ncbi:bacillithiol biosynthesis deacetylase BshB1 [Salibacterium aidingense]|uniref:bacillithiol biosynthesis deacetylase BshB1 n=1 Tax=Salibacterium aidingense TaxID=384933 RepID=UPI0004134E9F|nr:bacillithiol biosynthesis deacetylase BshB1 [Salibacterium aidingense]
MSRKRLLCIGAHPDDVEIGMGGTAALHAHNGGSVYICSLTKGELSSNGTVESRQQEAQASARKLKAKRYQLDFPDRGISSSHTQYHMLVDLIREIQPDTISAPFFEDRHPDHAACSITVREAVFDAGILKYPDLSFPPHKTASFFYYFINGIGQPDFYVDITTWQQCKEEALSCYQSQFVKTSDSVRTPLTEGYIESVRARDAVFGKQAGTRFAEGFKNASPLVLSSIP